MNSDGELLRYNGGVGLTSFGGSEACVGQSVTRSRVSLLGCKGSFLYDIASLISEGVNYIWKFEELLGHSNLKTTIIFTQVLNRWSSEARNPFAGI
jgi:hypothetical protein